MNKAAVLGAATVLAIGLGLSACSSDSIDTTVVFEMEPAPAQPWTASGDLVDGGTLCSSGDRANVDLAFPDGSPMTLEQALELFDDAWAAGGSPMDVARIGWEEYRCSDGSGTFTIREEVRPASGTTDMVGEVVGGTGAYASLAGRCVTVITEDETRTEILEIISTCEFEFPPAE